MWPNPQFSEGLVKLTEEILNWKLHFLCGVCYCAVYVSGVFRRYYYRKLRESGEALEFVIETKFLECIRFHIDSE